MELTTIQIDVETREILRKIAKEDFRSMAAELQWLVNQETCRRYSQPNPVITVEQAAAAGLAILTGEDESIIYPVKPG